MRDKLLNSIDGTFSSTSSSFELSSIFICSYCYYYGGSYIYID